jgi:hypothetical protein
MSRRRQRRPQPTTDGRPAEQRLEALVREPNPDRAQRTLARILDDLDAGPAPGPWLDAARTLRDRLVISEDTFLFFGVMFTECLIPALADTDLQLRRLTDETETIETDYGLRHGEEWAPDEAPPEWRALTEEWGRRADALIVANLRRMHHDELAELLETNADKFHERATAGRVDLWGTDEGFD